VNLYRVHRPGHDAKAAVVLLKRLPFLFKTQFGPAGAANFPLPFFFPKKNPSIRNWPLSISRAAHIIDRIYKSFPKK
jgi:hypothetical protein